MFLPCDVLLSFGAGGDRPHTLCSRSAKDPQGKWDCRCERSCATPSFHAGARIEQDVEAAVPAGLLPSAAWVGTPCRQLSINSQLSTLCSRQFFRDVLQAS